MLTAVLVILLTSEDCHQTVSNESIKITTDVRSVYENVDRFFIAFQLALQILALGVPQLQSRPQPANAVHRVSLHFFSCMPVAVNLLRQIMRLPVRHTRQSRAAGTGSRSPAYQMPMSQALQKDLKVIGKQEIL